MFFVGGPDGLNFDRSHEDEADNSSLPTARDTQTLPRDINEQVRALAERARQLAAEQATRAEKSGLGEASTGAAASGLGAAAPNPAASGLGQRGGDPSASGMGRRNTDPSASGMGAAAAPGGASGPRRALSPSGTAATTGDAGADTDTSATQPSEPAATPEGLDGLDALAALAAAAEDDNPAPPESAAEGTRAKSASGAVSSVEEKPWRIRAEGEMVYDFIDTSATRRWISSRGSLDELECSSDGGKSWTLVVDEPAFADVRAGGLRSRATTGSVRAISAADDIEAVRAMRQTGPLPSVSSSSRSPQTSTTATASEPRASRNTEAAPNYEPFAARKILLVLTLLLSIAVAVVYFRPQEERPYGINIPDSPAGTRLTWIMAQITGGSARLTANDLPAQFTEDAIARATPERLLSTLTYFDDWAPRYTILRWLERPTDHRIVGLLETPGGHRGIVEIQTEPTPPHKIQGMLFREAR